MLIIRSALLAASLACAPALAQQSKADDVHAAALRIAHIEFTESGILPGILSSVSNGKMGPYFRETYLDAPRAARIKGEKREKLAAYVDTMAIRYPAMMEERIPTIEEVAAAAFIRSFTGEEIEQIAAYLGSEDGFAVCKAFVDAIMKQRATKGPPVTTEDILLSLTTAQLQSMAAFSTTAGGRAFERFSNLSASITTEAITKGAIVEVIAIFHKEVCAIVGSPCGAP